MVLLLKEEAGSGAPVQGYCQALPLRWIKMRNAGISGRQKRTCSTTQRSEAGSMGHGRDPAGFRTAPRYRAAAETVGQDLALETESSCNSLKA